MNVFLVMNRTFVIFDWIFFANHDIFHLYLLWYLSFLYFCHLFVCRPSYISTLMSNMINVDKRDYSILSIGFASHHSDWNWQNVKSPFIRIFLPAEGEAELILPTETITLRQGKIYCIANNVQHSYRCTSDFSHFYLHVCEEYTDQASIFDEIVLPVEVDAPCSLRQYFQRICEMVPELALCNYDPKSYDKPTVFATSYQKIMNHNCSERMEIKGLLFTIMAPFFNRIIRKSDCYDARIAKSVEYIQQHLSEKIDIPELAEMVFMSRGHFTLLFKTNTGSSPKNYINSLKIHKAQLMLITMDVPIKKIAYSLGFDEVSYFCRIFKSTTGVTPEQYRITNGF